MKTKLIPKHQQPSLPLLPGLEGFVYKGPTYLELQKQIDPITRNLIAINVARKNNPTREIVTYKDSDGNTKTTTNVQAGALSPVDPVGEFVVAGAAMNKPLEAAGKGLLYGVGRFGTGKALNWARGKILSGAMNNNITGTIPYEIIGDRTPYGLYRFLLPNGTIRLRLPEHTSAKPREIKIDPKKGEGHNIHMRTWDDPVKHIPANMSTLDKSFLFNGLTEELPEGTVINIPESSSDFLATRGTIAGIKHLERNPKFTPGNKSGSVMYDNRTPIEIKNGVAPKIEVYPTTNFVKKAHSTNPKYLDFNYTINGDAQIPIINEDFWGGHYIEQLEKEFPDANWLNGKHEFMDVETQVINALLLMLSRERFNVIKKLTQEARDKGYIGPSDYLMFDPVKDNPKVILTNYTGKDTWNGVYDYLTNTIKVRPDNISTFTPFHEALHQQRIADVPKTNVYNQIILRNGNYQKLYPNLTKKSLLEWDRIDLRSDYNEAFKKHPLYEEYEKASKTVGIDHIIKARKLRDQINRDLGEVYNKYLRNKTELEDIQIPMSELRLYEIDSKRASGTNKLLKDKVLFLMPESSSDYIRQPWELAAHGWLTGERLSIKPFSKYPGDEIAEKIILKAKDLNLHLSSANTSDTAHKKAFWDLLTGQYLNYALPITVGATQINKEK